MGSTSNSMWHVPGTNASHHTRETGPPEQPQREVRRPLLAQSRPSAAAQKILQGRRKPSVSSLFASRITRAPTRPRLRSEVRSLCPRRCCLRGASGLRQPPRDIPRAIASSAVPAEVVSRWPRRSPGEDAGRRSPRWLPSGVR